MFTKEMRVRVHDIDATGVLYFIAQFRMAHDVLDEFLESRGFGFDYLYNKSTQFLLPMRHAESDYLASLFMGDLLQITLSVDDVSESSFTFLFEYKRGGELVGVVRTVHVAVDKITRKKIPLPPALRSILEPHIRK